MGEGVKKRHVNSNGVVKTTSIFPTLASVGLLLPLFLVLSQCQTGVMGWTGVLFGPLWMLEDENRGQGSSRGQIRVK